MANSWEKFMQAKFSTQLRNPALARERELIQGHEKLVPLLPSLVPSHTASLRRKSG